jgi:hypothetical protein
MKAKRSSQRQRHRDKHTPSVKRWAQRKKCERAQNVDGLIDDVAIAGSRRNLFMQRCHLHKVKAECARAERKMLETTSLRDLIH